MKVAVIAGYAPSLLNFRGPLLRAIRAHGHEVVALAPGDDDGSVAAGLRAFGVSFVRVRISRAGTNPVTDTRTLYDLTRVLRRVRPDKVLSYTPKPVIWGSLAARAAHTPEVYALITGLGRAFGDSPRNRRFRSWVISRTARELYRVGLAACTGVMFQNTDDRQLFEELHLLRRAQPRIVVAGSGVDLDHYAPSPAPNGRIIFLTLTRLLDDKGVTEFVDAARTLKRRYPQAEFRVVGPPESGVGGIPRKTLVAWAAAGHVTLAPAVADVREELRRASVYVLASAYREGVPRSILEALSTGRPVVTTDVPGCRETVVEGRNGFLVPPRNAAALATALERFLARPELVQRMGSESRRLACERFDVRIVNSQMLEFTGLA